MSKILLIIYCFCSSVLLAQLDTKVSILQSPLDNVFNISKVNVTKSGPYIGIQRGKYAVLEIGGEKQWKRVTFRKPKTHALRLGANYNFKYNVIGYDVGYWFKLGRLDLTYGANIVCRTDFDIYSFGISPTIGYKLQQFHLQTGYHFLSNPINSFETNSLFISLRYVFINERKWNISKNQKKKKKKDDGFFQRLKK
ncbi:MAG: hypothetical protein ACSHXL_07840 [Bacteroidota bacterium]